MCSKNVIGGFVLVLRDTPVEAMYSLVVFWCEIVALHIAVNGL